MALTRATDKIIANADGNLNLSGIVTATTIKVGAAISMTDNAISATRFHGDGSGLTGLSGVSVANQADNRLITATGTTDALNAESTLTYDGADLNISNNTPQLILTDTNSNNSFGRVRGNGGNLILSADHNNATAGSVMLAEMDGSEKIRLDSDGKVGINTVDAQFGNASQIASASLYHSDPKFGVQGSIVIGNLSGTATDERQLAFYRRGGPTPGTPMSTHKMGRIAWYGSSNDTSLPDLAGSIQCVPNGGGWTAGTNRRGSITFNNHEKETVRINSTGYVGIGTEDPQRPLVISTTANTGAEFNIPDPNGGLSLNIYNRGTTAYHSLSFNAADVRLGINAIEKARLDNNGNWCVGITGGSAKLHTKGEQSGGLIKCDAAEGTSRFFVTGNDTNACEVNLYDGAGSQKGILKAESDGMSMKGGGTPSQLQFFTTVTGGSSTRRFLIDDYGATQIERGSNGWSTLYHKTNNGGTRYHYRQASTGSSGTTINLIRIRRHYWGSGNYKISTRQTYYNGSFESVHFISGHAANGNTSAFSINYVNINGGNSSQIQKTATSHSSPGNNYAGWIDVYISIVHMNIMMLL
ncbi:MAG: hypothetical protein CM15mV32_0060 [Caudoviricetes sp.]|nr:MAG: hypothetical protein CM15mV32_0060 [Caudoviricetes sp.]